MLHFAASDRQHCFLCEFFWDALSNKVCVDTTVDGAAVLFVRGATRFFFSFALLFGQTGGLCLFLAAALSGNGLFFFASCTLFRFLLLASCTLFCFDALAFSQLSASFFFGFTACCGFNLCFVLSFGITAGLFCRFTLNALFVLTLCLFRLAALLFAVAVVILVHQQSHFVVRFELGSQLLIEAAMERYGISRLTEATELLYSRNGMSATQKYEAIQGIFTQLADHSKTGSRRGLRSFGEVMDDWVADLEKRFDPSGEQRGMSTGIPSLDRLLAPKGLVKGSLFVIGARPKMGKTTLYGQMAINCAVREKKPALMFSLEMPGDQILEKLVGQRSGVNPSIFYMPATDDADDQYQGDYDGDFKKAIATAGRLSEIDMLYIDDTPGLSLAHIVSESRRIKREKGCVGMILVDYLTLMTAEKADRNDLAYGMITKGLKNLAKELGCVVVLLTQLNRELEKRVNKRPLPSDSRDTGQIEQDCDYWVGIHREGAFDDSVPPGETELILRLNRHGSTGTVYCNQINGAIYDTDQQAAAAERRGREQQPKKKGGF